jgi:hypothetical protein
MMTKAHNEMAGGIFSAGDFARARIVTLASSGLPLAQLLLLSRP